MVTTRRTDNRRHIRIAPDLSQPIRIDINGDNFIDILKATDISEGGVGIYVTHGFEGCAIDSYVSFVITIPLAGKRRIIHANGRIKHVSGHRFGVAFSNISSQDRVNIRQYIANQIKAESLANWLKYKFRLIK